MKRSIRIQPAADADLVQHAAYIAADNPEVADRFALAVAESFSTLAEMPRAGRPRTVANQRL